MWLAVGPLVFASPPQHRAARPAHLEGDLVTRVLIVEDEESYSDVLAYVLDREGFQVSVVATGPEALAHLDRYGTDLVLLDLILPRLSGLEVCRRLRATSDVPIIIVTGKDSEIDKIVGLELGADDYVTKPFSARELVARIHAVLRRAAHPEAPMPTVVQAGPVRLDVAQRTGYVNGEQVRFALEEFQLLTLLVHHAGRALSRTQLIDRVWGAQLGDAKTLAMHIQRIRRKIEPDPQAPRYLKTVRGLGYTFDPDSAPGARPVAESGLAPLA